MSQKKSQKTIIDREKLNTLPRCPACGRNFHLGEAAVYAWGEWEDSPRVIHEEDAIFDDKTDRYVEIKFFEKNVQPDKSRP